MTTIHEKNESKRGSLRIESRTMGQIINLESRISKEAIVDDISTGGFRIKIVEVDEKFAETADQVEISFNFPVVDDDHEGKEKIIVRGVVRYCKNEEHGWTILGIQAVDDDSARMEKLENTWLALVFENIEE